MTTTERSKLTSMSAVLNQFACELTLNELRCIIQYAGIPVFTDGRTRTRYLDEAGVKAVKESVRRYRYGRAAYCNPRIHPTFAGSGVADEQ
jgi:hypothetical protein